MDSEQMDIVDKNEPMEQNKQSEQNEQNEFKPQQTDKKTIVIVALSVCLFASILSLIIVATVSKKSNDVIIFAPEIPAPVVVAPESFKCPYITSEECCFSCSSDYGLEEDYEGGAYFSEIDPRTFEINIPTRDQVVDGIAGAFNDVVDFSNDLNRRYSEIREERHGNTENNTLPNTANKFCEKCKTTHDENGLGWWTIGEKIDVFEMTVSEIITNFSITDIQKWNNIRNLNQLTVGERIIVCKG